MGPCPAEEEERYGTPEAWLEALGLTVPEIFEFRETWGEDLREGAELLAQDLKIDAQREARLAKAHDRLTWLHLPYPHHPTPIRTRLRINPLRRWFCPPGPRLID